MGLISKVVCLYLFHVYIFIFSFMKVNATYMMYISKIYYMMNQHLPQNKSTINLAYKNDRSIYFNVSYIEGVFTKLTLYKNNNRKCFVKSH